MIGKFFPPRDSLFMKFFPTPKNFKMAAGAFVNRQGKSPVPIGLTYKPVVHVGKPVKFPLKPKLREPMNFGGDIFHARTEGSAIFSFFVHCNIPLISDFPD